MPNLFQSLPQPDPTDPNFNPEKLILLITNRINDLIWEKYQVEEEDFIEAMKKPSIANDLEVGQIAMQLEMIMMQMSGGMGGMGGFGGEDGGMGGMPPGMMGMPGMGGPGMGGPGMGGMGGFY